MTFIILILFGGCATETPAYISKIYEIYGTWVNPDYNNLGHCAKYVFHHNGIVEYINQNSVQEQ